MRKYGVPIALVAGAFIPALLWWLLGGGQAREAVRSREPARVVSLCVPATEILCELGVADKIVGITVTSAGNVPEILKDVPRIGRTFGNLNMEAILGLHPDLVFCFSWGGRDELLSKRGLATYGIDTSTLEDVIRLVEEIGRIMNRSERAAELAREMRSRIERVRAKVAAIRDRPLVYFESGSLGKTRGPGTLTHDFIVRAGGRNMAGEEGVPYPLLSTEYIIDRDPDVIIVEEYGVSPEELMRRDGWGDLKAVRDGRVHRSPSHYTNYTPRCLDGLEQFARWFHPEVFGP